MITIIIIIIIIIVVVIIINGEHLFGRIQGIHFLCSLLTFDRSPVGIVGIAEHYCSSSTISLDYPDSPLDTNVEAEKRNYRAAPRERIEQGDP